jgi:hypothetical protein
LYSGQAGSDVPGDILHTLYVYGDFTLGIEDTKINDSALVVFPNPVANILNVHASSEIQTVQIYTSTGQKLRAITVDGSKEIRVDVSALSPQLYYIEIKTAKGVVLEKLIKE